MFVLSSLFLFPWSPLKSETVVSMSFLICVGLRFGLFVFWSIISGQMELMKIDYVVQNKSCFLLFPVGFSFFASDSSVWFVSMSEFILALKP